MNTKKIQWSNINILEGRFLGTLPDDDPPYRFLIERIVPQHYLIWSEFTGMGKGYEHSLEDAKATAQKMYDQYVKENYN